MGAAPPEGQGSVTLRVRKCGRELRVWRRRFTLARSHLRKEATSKRVSEGRADGAQKEGIQLLTLPTLPTPMRHAALHASATTIALTTFHTRAVHTCVAGLAGPCQQKWVLSAWPATGLGASLTRKYLGRRHMRM